MNSIKRGQESIWNYPTPPVIENANRHVQVFFNGVILAETYEVKQILETGHPPVYYLPPEDVKIEYLTPGSLVTFCKWKGLAQYVKVEVAGKLQENAGWFYPNPNPQYTELENFFAFYAHLVDACYVDDERVVPEPFSLHGGWITHDITGPFIGDTIL